MCSWVLAFTCVYQFFQGYQNVFVTISCDIDGITSNASSYIQDSFWIFACNNKRFFPLMCLSKKMIEFGTTKVAYKQTRFNEWFEQGENSTFWFLSFILYWSSVCLPAITATLSCPWHQESIMTRPSGSNILKIILKLILHFYFVFQGHVWSILLLLFPDIQSLLIVIPVLYDLCERHSECSRIQSNYIWLFLLVR